MRTYDFSPLYRSTVGFDRLFDMLDQTARAESTPNWPPYNIERTSEDDYRIMMALAGFSPGEIELVQKENTLFVAGHKNAEQDEGAEVLHRGIATRSFRQSFNLAEHVKVVGAHFENGLLFIDLKREVPEALKPRRIEIRPIERDQRHDPGSEQSRVSAPVPTRLRRLTPRCRFLSARGGLSLSS
ncbi:MAG: Hsp20 family protein [Microvirga sp.]